MMRKFGIGAKDGPGTYAAGVRLGQAKSAKWLARKSGGRCMTADADDPGKVEGGKARPNLGRPGRKAFKDGGAARKGMWAGGYDDDKDDKEKSAELADKSKTKGGFLKGMKKGALHKEMGIPVGDKIPAKKLDKATHSSNPLLKKRAVLAKTMKSWSKG